MKKLYLLLFLQQLIISIYVIINKNKCIYVRNNVLKKFNVIYEVKFKNSLLN